MKKTLYFEGAGCVPCGDVENCRIRTAFHLDNGMPVYLEMSGSEVGNHLKNTIYENYSNLGTVDYCF